MTVNPAVGAVGGVTESLVIGLFPHIGVVRANAVPGKRSTGECPSFPQGWES